MHNYDESILRTQCIDPSAPYPVLHQAVRIVLYDEYAARSFYSRVNEAFGERAPFSNIVQSEQRHIAALNQLCERFGIPRPLDPFPNETTIDPSWLRNCQRAVAGEIANARLYDYLLGQVHEPEARQVFTRLQLASLEQHLPAFQHAVADAMAYEQYHAERGISPEQAYESHGPLSDFIEKTIAQVGAHMGPLGLVGPLLSRAHPALLAGAFVGGASVYLWKTARRGQRRAITHTST